MGMRSDRPNNLISGLKRVPSREYYGVKMAYEGGSVPQNWVLSLALHPPSCDEESCSTLVMKSHVAPLSEPTHDPNKHTTALRTNGSPSSRSGAAIACPEELRAGSSFQISSSLIREGAKIAQ